MNPYRNLPDQCFWSRAVTWVPTGQLDPMVGGALIRHGEAVVTMGSCFAQHLSRHLASLGLRYHIPEMPPVGMTPAEAQARNFGVFSARYGNVYTVRQAVQLFDRAFGRFQPVDAVWEAPSRGPTGYVDAFRPQIEPAPLGSPGAVRAAAEEHLAAVRRVFLEADWLVFTLGLTEAWRSRLDGAVYPTAPGVAGGDFDPERYEFVNFTAAEVRADLEALLERLASVNLACRVILTVSPVPLIATYEPRHVLVSTTVSKSILRVVADEVERAHAHVHYFPSFEIITSAVHEGRYWEDDLRQVADIGVSHVMRVFTRHFLTADQEVAPARVEATPVAARASLPQIVCDEEVIEAAMQAAGFGQQAAVRSDSLRRPSGAASGGDA